MLISGFYETTTELLTYEKNQELVLKMKKNQAHSMFSWLCFSGIVNISTE